MTRAASPKWIRGEGMGQPRNAIPGTLGNRGLNHELQATPAPIMTRVSYSVFWLHHVTPLLKLPDAAREGKGAFNYNVESIPTRASVSCLDVCASEFQAQSVEEEPKGS
ncbi:hypothetical protein PIB30_026092 [Stylosanthes scabra]|uniref:Uncharacterized protein n=1 Tax=Stylosanthes scabra TaxID=79078 RepID=A0ABU6RB41_9FABA|nr:hypothetical protein [Stylosanthes scabra]